MEEAAVLRRAVRMTGAEYCILMLGSKLVLILRGWSGQGHCIQAKR